MLQVLIHPPVELLELLLHLPHILLQASRLSHAVVLMLLLSLDLPTVPFTLCLPPLRPIPHPFPPKAADSGRYQAWMQRCT